MTSSPLPNHRFQVEIAGLTVGAFRSISGLNQRTDLMDARRAGDRHPRLVPGRTRWSPLVLERGLAADRTLWEWRQRVVDGEDDRRDCAVVVLAPDGSEALRYNLFEAWPLSWEGPQLSAQAPDTAIERIELAVEHVTLD